MVPVADAFGRTVHSVQTQLELAIAETNQPGDLSGMISWYFLRELSHLSSMQWNVFTTLDTWLRDHEGEVNDAPRLAVLGSMMEYIAWQRGKAPETVIDIFVSAVNRLTERKSPFGAPNSWILQPRIVL